ncbi:MAG: IS110 family transposase, partial [Lachnobacterium sp.]|nr:IS110 family transposase [Lachnobacterium sp.]
RKRLRYWLFQAAKSAVTHAKEFKELHEYYTTRKDNPLKKMQSLIVIGKDYKERHYLLHADCHRKIHYSIENDELALLEQQGL